MSNYEAGLIELYAAHDVAEIRATPELIENKFGQKIAALSTDTRFTTLKSHVETAKRRVESVRSEIESEGYAHHEVGECLGLLYRQRLGDENGKPISERQIESIKALLRAMYASRWSVAQKEHFEFACAHLINWEGGFLSYTNRRSRPHNWRYKAVIRRYIGIGARDPSWDEANIVADIIVSILKDERVSCFFDKTSVRTGDHLENHIRPAIHKAFVFIQLVQTGTFDTDQNWCYLEYQMFSEHLQQIINERGYLSEVFQSCFSPVLTDKKENLDPRLIPDHFRTWRREIFEDRHYATLPTSDSQFEYEVKKLAWRIIDLQQKILKAVPR